MATSKDKKDIETARGHILDRVKPTDTVYTILRHVSTSGMSRSISLIVMDGKQPYDISYLAAKVLGDKIDQKHGGIKVGGCGMDMGFDLVYRLGATLWPNGTALPHGNRNGKPDSDGGYALAHRWL